MTKVQQSPHGFLQPTERAKTIFDQYDRIFNNVSFISHSSRKIYLEYVNNINPFNGS